MSRLSRDKKRDQQWGATPIDVRVPLTGECATVAGTTVTAPAGEELHQAVLTHLHHLALTSGQPVHATIHDARIGWVVPLEITTDGASRFTAEPVRMAPRTEPAHDSAEFFEVPGGPVLLTTTTRDRFSEEAAEPTPSRGPEPTPRGDPNAPTPGATPGIERTPGEAAESGGSRQTPFGESPASTETPYARGGSAASASPAAPATAAFDAHTGESAAPAPYDHVPESPVAPGPHDPITQASATPAPHDRPAHPVPAMDETAEEPAPTFRMRTVSAPQPTDTEPSPPHALRHLPDAQPPTPPQAPPPGIAVPPTGAFGPPPVMDARPASAAEPLSPTHSAYTPRPLPTTPPTGAPLPPTDTPPTPTRSTPLLTPVPLLDDPDPKPAPVRGFDAVAEAVMGEGLVVEDTAVLGEAVERISEAVREGRTEVAAELAQETIAEASRTLGAEHPDVLRVRELAAYIAYLGGEPVQAADISLDLAGIQHRAGDAESAYGNLQSAATAWKAVRDPARGLALGGDLLALWTEMAAGEGPAADEPEKLESARSRMLRLAERARNANS
ncbi:hypothetical protein ABZ307_05365 [Streptomyces griseorubiginosus]|uniref:hypothetical protein n=1 Tax=Streptomyces griseorubiginosus TaxID=67304 RepID=UPI0033B3F2A5